MTSSNNNTSPGQGTSQAADFFGAICSQQSGGFLEIRAFPSDKDEPIQNFFSIPTESDKAASFATELKSQVFYGAAPRARREGKAEDVTALVTLRIDGDAEKGALPWTVLPLTPIAVVDSGNPSGRNYHAYYALDPPLELKTEADRNQAKVYLGALCTTLKGDPKSCDIARILRVPATYNTNDPHHPGLCRIIELTSFSFETSQTTPSLTTYFQDRLSLLAKSAGVVESRSYCVTGSTNRGLKITS